MSFIKCYCHSYIRRWLNGPVFNFVFSPDERSLISEPFIEKFVKMPDKETEKKLSPFYRKKGELHTEAMKTEKMSFRDKIFLLSLGDIISEEFGFTGDEKACDESRTAGCTDYAELMGVHVNDEGDATWRLRTTALNSFVRCLDGKGRASYFFSMDGFSNGIRPAITLDIGSDAFGNVSRGDLIEIGHYPQFPVTDEEELRCLEELQSFSQTDPDVSFEFGDVTLSGTVDRKYRAVCLNSYRNIWQKKAGFELNEVYWFKWDPVKWIILNPETGLAVCEKMIDAQTFVYGSSKKDVRADVLSQ